MRVLFGLTMTSELEKLIDIGINHEQQHQELLITDIKYILGHNPIFPTYQFDSARVVMTNSEFGWLEMSSGIYEIGAEKSGFAYDNEQGKHKVFLENYQISKSLVTNHDFLDFINDGCYKRHELWLSEGWSWINETGINSPIYWHQRDAQWFNYIWEGLMKIDPNSILCHVSHYQAAAYAEWSGMILPTEFEWEVASDKLYWGARWEHTNSAYLAYPGFKKPAGAIGEYNERFMMNKMVLRGASVATSPNHSRKTYRNFFHPNVQWHFSGIRLAKNG